MKNSEYSAKSKASAFNKDKCQTEIEVLFKPLLLIHAKRWRKPFFGTLKLTVYAYGQDKYKPAKPTGYASAK